MDLYEGLPVRLDADTSVSWTIDMTAGFDTYLHFYSKNPDTGALSCWQAMTTMAVWSQLC